MWTMRLLTCVLLVASFAETATAAEYKYRIRKRLCALEDNCPVEGGSGSSSSSGGSSGSSSGGSSGGGTNPVYCEDILGNAGGYGSLPDGVYSIDIDGSGPNPAFNAWCDMTTDGGGWTLFANILQGGVNYDSMKADGYGLSSLVDTRVASKPADTVARLRVEGSWGHFDLKQSAQSGAFQVMDVATTDQIVDFDTSIDQSGATIAALSTANCGGAPHNGLSFRYYSNYNSSPLLMLYGGFGSVINGAPYDSEPCGIDWPISQDYTGSGYICTDTMDICRHYNTFQTQATGVMASSLRAYYRRNVVGGSIHFTSSPILAAYQTQIYDYVARAISDVSDILTFTLLEAPSWLTDFTDNGDGSAHLGGIIPGSAVTGQVPPIFTSDPGVSAHAGTPYLYLPVSEDFDRNSVLFMTLLEAPEWAQLYESYNSALPNGYRMSIEAVPPAHVVATETPVFASAPITSGYNGTPYSYQVTVNDDDRLSVLWVSVLQKPEWAQLYQVYDGNWTLFVNAVPPGNPAGLTNAAPAFTSSPVTSGIRNAAYSYAITASDADKVDILNLTAPTKPAWLNLSWNGQTRAGTLSGTVPNAAGSHTVNLLLTDGGGASVPQNFTITVP